MNMRRHFSTKTPQNKPTPSEAGTRAQAEQPLTKRPEDSSHDLRAAVLCGTAVGTNVEVGHSSEALLARECDHRFGQGRNPANTFKGDIFESCFPEELPQRFNRPKLDVAIIPKRGEVLIELPA